jgi:hypothetical protein
MMAIKAAYSRIRWFSSNRRCRASLIRSAPTLPGEAGSTDTDFAPAFRAERFSLRAWTRAVACSKVTGPSDVDGALVFLGAACLDPVRFDFFPDFFLATPASPSMRW